jgi:hypothetical protein
MEMERFSHESYGQIQFNRVTGTANFYGSELTQQHYISMEVHNSEIVRDITQDRYFNLNQILRIRLTSGQFSELITSMNNGSGVPCTIERIGNKKVDKLPIQESQNCRKNSAYNQKSRNAKPRSRSSELAVTIPESTVTFARIFRSSDSSKKKISL